MLTGPVTGGHRGFCFCPGVEDVAGYVLEEYFLEGDCAAYSLAPGTSYDPGGNWNVHQTRSARFRTRMLVQRPLDASRFSGTVVVSWQNVTAGFELSMPPVDLAELGLAWVGVTTQRVAVYGFPGTEDLALRGWDPSRYGALEHPGDDFSFDVFSQAGRAVAPGRGELRPDEPDPMGGLPVTRVLAAGVSQSALRLRTYVNSIQPIERVFDGFLLSLDIGAGALVDTTDCDLSIPLRIPLAPTRIRADLDVPVLVLNSETEVPRLFPMRQPDSDRFRLWEVAGTAHISGPRVATAELTRQLERHAVPAAAVPRGEEDDSNTLSHAPVQRAALRHLVRWSTQERPPPRFPLVEVDDGDQPRVRRDRDGNAVGGIRLPDLAVPIAAHSGVREGEPDILKRIAGYSRPFSVDALKSRYMNAADYLGAYAAAVDAAIGSGFLVPEEKAELLEAAARVAETMSW